MTWNEQLDRCSRVLLAVDLYMAAIMIQDLMGDKEAEAFSIFVLFSLQSTQILVRFSDAIAGIGNGDYDESSSRSFLGTGAYFELAAVMHGIDGIIDDIENGLLQMKGIGQNRGNIPVLIERLNVLRIDLQGREDLDLLKQVN